MKKIILNSLLILLAVAFSACANKVHDYSVSTDNMITLKELSKTGKTIKVGDFTDSNKNESKIMCRLSAPIGTPKGETFASYIKSSLKKELIVADMYSEKAKNTITANLDDLYGSTVPSNTYWKFDVTLKSSNGTTYSLVSKYMYESSYLATSACSEMQRAFVPAVQKLNKDIIKHQKFKKLFN